MPRGLENLLAIGFALILAPALLSFAVRISLGDQLAGLIALVPFYLGFLMFDIVAKNRLGLSGAKGRWIVLGFAIAVTCYGLFEMYKMFGENQRVSPLGNNLVAFGWLLAIIGPFIIFAQLGSRPAVAYLTPEPAEAKG
jgi:hypothetical protein